MRTRRLIVVTPEGERELLFIGRLTVGRAPECDISLADTKISRRHAEFDASGPMPRVTDLGSRNGILVNGRKVGAADLVPGDVVTVGDASIRFEERAAEVLEPRLRPRLSTIARRSCRRMMPPAAAMPAPCRYRPLACRTRSGRAPRAAGASMPARSAGRVDPEKTSAPAAARAAPAPAARSLPRLDASAERTTCCRHRSGRRGGHTGRPDASPRRSRADAAPPSRPGLRPPAVPAALPPHRRSQPCPPWRLRHRCRGGRDRDRQCAAGTPFLLGRPRDACCGPARRPRRPAGALPLMSASSSALDALSQRQARTLAGWLAAGVDPQGTTVVDPA